MKSVIVCAAGMTSGDRCRFFAAIDGTNGNVELLCVTHDQRRRWNSGEAKYDSEEIPVDQRIVVLTGGGSNG